MATANHNNVESTISSEALGLLDCFSGELEDVVYRIAEQIASQRTGSKTRFEVTADDIERAATVLTSTLSADLPVEYRAEVSAMLECLTTKLKQRKC